MTTLEILKAGRALIADPARWVQRFPAVDKNGYWCDPTSFDAVKFCSAGALQNVSQYCFPRESRAALYALMSTIGGLEIDTFNDNHSHAEVLAAWDRAIEHLQERTTKGVTCEQS